MRTGGRPDAGQRRLRVGESVRHALTDILRRGHFRDPELQALNVSITEVRMSPDLKNATAFVQPLGGDAARTETCVLALNRAAAYLRGELAKVIEMRSVPGLKFEADTSLDYARRIDDLLKLHAAGEDPPAS